MKLSEWADRNGVARHTAYRWFRDGKLPVPATRVGRLILVTPPVEPAPLERVALYAYTSSPDDVEDARRQHARLVEWAQQQGLDVGWVVSDTDGRDTRPWLNYLLDNPEVTRIIVEGRDQCGPYLRLINSALSAQGRSIIVLDEHQDDRTPVSAALSKSPSKTLNSKHPA